MLTILIKTNNPEAELYLYLDNRCLDQKIWVADRALAETISEEIDGLLKRNQYELSQVEGIGIFKGPGSFTGLRIGHSVANALAYGLRVPLIGAQGENWRQQAVSLLLSGENEQQVMPEYGSPPHITPPRK